jgi:hypothetical protein
VKSEPKAFASLSSGLLARKGAARPAMRPQGFGQMGAGLEDLGWNDLGFEAPKPAETDRDSTHDAFGEEVVDHPERNGHAGLTPIPSHVHTQQAEIADRFTANDEDEGEEIDETAEIYDPEVDEAPEQIFAETPQPVVIAPVVEAPAPVLATKPVAQVAPRRAPRARAAAGAKGKAAFTLRLDPERHLKLRLACAVHGRSAQQIVTDALDGLLANMPELEVMAQKANRKG